MRLPPFLTIALLATTAFGPAAAQTPADADSVWRAALARLTPGTTVRVHSRDRGRIEGRVVGTWGTTLNLDTGAAPAEWSTAALDSLWVRGTAAKTGAIVGAVPGAVAGGLLGVVANELGCKESGDTCPEAVPLLGLGGAAAGALLGAIVGSLIPKWHRRVP